MNFQQSFSDTELVLGIKNSEKKAYRLLFERYAPNIYNFSLSYLKNESDAEELVQDVFLKVWEKREYLDQSKNMKSFLFKIAVNTIYDFIRRKNIEHAFHDYAKSNFIRDDNFTWHTVVFEEMQQNLEVLLAKLPPKQQQIYTLSRVKGLSNDEISDQLKLSKRTVENQLYRALAFLKTHFNKNSVFALLFLYLHQIY